MQERYLREVVEYKKTSMKGQMLGSRTKARKWTTGRHVADESKVVGKYHKEI